VIIYLALYLVNLMSIVSKVLRDAQQIEGNQVNEKYGKFISFVMFVHLYESLFEQLAREFQIS